MLGERVARVEDPGRITGRGRYVEDVGAPGAVHVAIVHGPHPRPCATGVDDHPVRACSGVIEVFSPEDLPDVPFSPYRQLLSRPLPHRAAVHGRLPGHASLRERRHP